MSGGAAPKDGEGKMGLCALFFMAFFWVSGGIYGNEALITAAPAGIVFGLLVFVPLVYALPIALINAELAAAIPADGGLVVWVQMAADEIGLSTLGIHNSWWVWNSYIFDSSIFPLLAAQYTVTAMYPGDDPDDAHYFLTGLISDAIIVGCTLLKLLGNDVLVTFATVLGVGSLLPTGVFILWGLFGPAGDIPCVNTAFQNPNYPNYTLHTDTEEGTPALWDKDCSGVKLRPSLWIVTVDPDAPPLNMDLLLSWLLWLYSGYLSLGTLAGCVDNPQRTFPLVIAMIMPFSILLNMVPFWVALSMDADTSHYEDGYFSELAKVIGGEWLATGFLIGSNVCLIGLYSNTILTCEIASQFFVDSQFPRVNAWAMTSGGGCLGRWRRWLFEVAQEGGASRMYIVANACVALVLVWLPYKMLIECTMVLIALSTVLFLGAWVVLRVKKPELERPFKVPGGTLLGTVVCIPPLLLTAYQTYSSLVDLDPSDGGTLEIGSHTVKYAKAWALVLIVGLGFAAQAAYRLIDSYCGLSLGVDGQRVSRKEIEMELIVGDFLQMSGSASFTAESHPQEGSE